MAYDAINNQWTLTPEMERLKTEREGALELQERKHQDWNDNYELYRNKVKTNRLTQRQAVNIPLMKETIKTTLSKIDDPPQVEWKEKSGDEYKQLIYQEIWDKSARDNNLELLDVMDKKNVLMYGLSCKKLNITEDGVIPTVLDPFDIVLDPLMQAWKLDTARFIIHQNIFRSIRDILADPKYSKQGKEELKMWADSPPGITQSQTNKEEWEKKMERLKSMGLDHADFAHFAGGDRIINLTEHYTSTWNTKTKEFEKRVVVYAENCIELYNETLEDCIGVDFWPFVIWAEDPETNDVYPDSIADLVRTPNKVLNVWFSQLIENRTLKNFQMHWFSPSENYQPQTYTPGPGMMLPAPPGDDINKVIKPVEISGLDDTLEAISIVTQIVERGSGATAIDKGQPEQGQQTLGEIQILVGKANERATALTKFYRIAWYEYARKWDMLMHANSPKLLKLFKVSSTGKVFPKNVFMSEWKSEAGYEPIVRSTSEMENESTKEIQKYMFLLGQFPQNMTLRQIAQRRMLGLVDFTPEELKQVEEEEKRMQSALEAQANNPQQQAQTAQQVQAGPQAPDNTGLVQQIQDQISQLQGA